MNDKNESVEKEPIDEVIAATAEDATQAAAAEAEIVADVEAEVVEGEIETPEEAIARLESELAEARAKAEMAVDQMQRTAAEYQNARRRQERQLQDSIERATEGLIRRLLPVLDDFDLPLATFRGVAGRRNGLGRRLSAHTPEIDVANG
ncbi:MAG: nucleotide exchange factor GrpE [Caldilineaceae bacterium]